MNSLALVCWFAVPLQAPPAAPASTAVEAPPAVDAVADDEDEEGGTFSVLSFGDPPPPAEDRASTAPPPLSVPPPVPPAAAPGATPNPFEVPLYAQPATTVMVGAPWLGGGPWFGPSVGWGGGYGGGYGYPLGMHAGFFLGGNMGLAGWPVAFNIWGRSGTIWNPNPWMPAVQNGASYGYSNGHGTERWNVRVQSSPVPNAGYRSTQVR